MRIISIGRRLTRACLQWRRRRTRLSTRPTSPPLPSEFPSPSSAYLMTSGTFSTGSWTASSMYSLTRACHNSAARTSLKPTGSHTVSLSTGNIIWRTKMTSNNSSTPYRTLSSSPTSSPSTVTTLSRRSSLQRILGQMVSWPWKKNSAPQSL